MTKKWWTHLKVLISPLALGIYLTLTFVWLGFLYYNVNKSGFIIQSVRRAHELSVDYRLLARGPVKPKSPVVLLTADAHSVETLGRWPWPRSLMARAVNTAMKDGAQVLGFDIIFAEDERNDLLTTSENLFAEGVIDQNLKQRIAQIAQAQDGDTLLAKTLDENRSRLVAGTYYQFPEADRVPGEVDTCYDMIFRTTEDFKLWDQEEVLISIQDPYQIAIPAPLMEVFSQIIETKRAGITKELDAAKGSGQNNIEIHHRMRQMCHTFFDDAAEVINPIWAAQIQSRLNPAEFNFASYKDWLNDFRGKALPNGVPGADYWDMNTAKIQSSFSHSGYFNAEQDSDGTIRSSPLVTRTGFFYFPSLALKTYLVGKDRNASIKLEYNPATSRKEIVKFEITDNNTGEVVEEIPTDGQGRVLINYAGPQKMFPHLGVAELLSGAETMTIQERVYDPKEKIWVEKDIRVNRKDFLKGKYLIVGATATGIYDLRVTPFEKKTYPGLETHANVLSNLLEHRFLKPWAEERVQMLAFLVILGVTHTLLLTQLGALGGMAMTLVLLAGIIAIDQFALFGKGLVVTIVWPLLMVLGNYLVLTTYRYLTEERGKKELRATFQKYVSPSIVEEILSDPKNIELGGKKMNLTVMFSDVRGFTTISEKLDPHALSNLLNQYLTPMTEIVFTNQGTLDKYMGDAIMAFFGAPIPIEKHAHFACRAALQSLDKLFELQKEFNANGLPMIDIGIGLNSGEVSAGNMGSKTVRSYTVMGDAVNLASRLEGINKEYGTRIVISEFTFEQVKSHFTCREIDWVRVKGKTKPVKIYELIREGMPQGNSAKHLEIYTQAYSLYRSQNWLESQELFSRALDVDPNDQVSQLFLSRCANYIDSPPDSGWDGVFEMKTK